MISNLVTNAILHSEVPENQHRWMRLTVGVRGPYAELSVSNSGPRMHGEALAQLFEPFQRRNGHNGRDRRGVGLGLTIVRSVAETHGGAVTIEALDPGGLRLVVRLPAGQLE
jgi:signal transduction histidine kinase